MENIIIHHFHFRGDFCLIYGSVLLIKSFGRLGFNPWSIMNDGDFDGFKLAINMLVSAIGGVLGLVFAKIINNKFNK